VPSADITPQIARIDAKQGSDKISKYCYVNAILQTKADDFYCTKFIRVFKCIVT
jgi:ATP phosphoribosyltransferase regulatory subunit